MQAHRRAGEDGAGVARAVADRHQKIERLAGEFFDRFRAVGRDIDAVHNALRESDRRIADLGNALARLIKPGGKAVLCLFGRRCLWEILWYSARGDSTRAFRRLRPDGMLVSLAPGRDVLVHYPSVDELERELAPHFRLRSWRGVGIAVPPSYLEYLAVRFSRLFRCAAALDSLLGRLPGIRALADHVVVMLERVAG